MYPGDRKPFSSWDPTRWGNAAAFIAKRLVTRNLTPSATVHEAHPGNPLELRFLGRAVQPLRGVFPLSPSSHGSLDHPGRARLDVMPPASELLEQSGLLKLAPEKLEGTFHAVVFTQPDFGHGTPMIDWGPASKATAGPPRSEPAATLRVARAESRTTSRASRRSQPPGPSGPARRRTPPGHPRPGS
jgi:hypothetical protein